MKITVNGKTEVSNFPEISQPENLIETLKEGKDEGFKLEDDPSLYTFQLDTYTLPSLLLKVIKSMKKNEVCELQTTRVDKLKTNFPSELFN